MGLIHDSQFDKDINKLTDVTLTAGAGTQYGDIIDTIGADSLTVAMYASAPIGGADTVTLSFMEDDDPAMGSATAVSADQTLPTRRSDAQTMIAPSTGHLQTIGVVDTKRYVRLRFVKTALAANHRVELYRIKSMLNKPFNDWDPAYTSVDGQP